MRHESPLQRAHRNLPPPWDRIFSLGTRLVVWGLIFAILYLLRPFFLLIFLTFVFAYIQAHGVDGLAHRVRHRAGRVVMVAVVFLGFLGAVGYFLAPRLAEQVQEFAGNYDKYLGDLDKTVHQIGTNLETKSQATAPTPNGTGDAPPNGQGEPPAGQEGDPAAKVAEPSQLVKMLKGFNSRELLENVLGLGSDEGPVEGPAAEKAALKQTIKQLQDFATNILTIGSAFLLSLLFSFLIVLDLPHLTRSVQGMANTKLGFIYDEVADNIRDFGRVLGTALEAQLFIAIANTILTGIGLWAMGLPSLVFLSTIVFFCSFIPVAGVFLSSTPICLVALQTGGIQLMLIGLGLILAIHFIEAYFLNPKIFGHHFRMNAVVVLIVLTVGGKLFGVWGLVLGLPVVNYFFAHAIRYRADERGDDAPAAQSA